MFFYFFAFFDKRNFLSSKRRYRPLFAVLALLSFISPINFTLAHTQNQCSKPKLNFQEFFCLKIVWQGIICTEMRNKGALLFTHFTNNTNICTKRESTGERKFEKIYSRLFVFTSLFQFYENICRNRSVFSLRSLTFILAHISLELRVVTRFNVSRRVKDLWNNFGCWRYITKIVRFVFVEKSCQNFFGKFKFIQQEKAIKIHVWWINSCRINPKKTSLLTCKKISHRKKAVNIKTISKLANKIERDSFSEKNNSKEDISNSSHL